MRHVDGRGRLMAARSTKRIEHLAGAVVRQACCLQMRAINAASVSLPTRDDPMSAPSLLRRRATSPISQLAASLATWGVSPAARVTASKLVRESSALRHRERIVGRQAVLFLEAPWPWPAAVRASRRERARSTPARSRAAAGRGPESSDSRARLPWCASPESRRSTGRTAPWPAALHRRPGINSICQRISKSMACCMKRNEFRFLISRLVP